MKQNSLREDKPFHFNKVLSITGIILLLSTQTILLPGESAGRDSKSYTPSELASLIARVDSYLAAGSIDSAVIIGEDALAEVKSERGEIDTLYASVLSSLGAAYYYSGDYDRCDDCWKRSLSLREELLPENHPLIASSYLDRGIISQAKGRLSQAERFYKQSLSIREAILDPGHEDIAIVLNNLAGLLILIGKYAEGEKILRRAISLTEELYGHEHPETAMTRSHLGILFMYQGRYPEAIDNLENNLTILEHHLSEEHPMIAVMLNNLASAYIENRQYAEAESVFTRVITLKKKLYGIEHPEVAITLVNFSDLYRRIQHYPQAESLCLEALKNFGSQHDPGNQYMEMGTYILARIYYEQGKYDQVQTLFKGPFDLLSNKATTNYPAAVEGLTILSRNYRSLKDYDASLEAYRQLHYITGNFIESVFPFASEDQKFRYLEKFPLLDHSFLSFTMDYPRPEVVKSALEMVLRSKAIVIDAMAEEKKFLFCTYDDDVRKAGERHAEISDEIATLTISAAENVPADIRLSRLSLLYVEKDSLERELSRQCSEFRRDMATKQFSVEDIADAIPENSMIIELLRYHPYEFDNGGNDEKRTDPARYVAFILDREGLVTLNDLGAAATIDSLIGEVRRRIYRAREAVGGFSLKKSNESVSQLSSALYRILLSPLEGRLEGKEDLYISPDGQLSLLPFEILVCPDGEYLVEKHSISYLSSGREILRFERERDRGEGALVVADPTFDLSGEDMAASRTRVLREEEGEAYALGGTRGVSECLGEKFGRLSSTREEGILVRDALEDAGVSGVRCYDGEEALEEVVKGCRQAPRVLHIATHGFFCEDAEIGGGRIVENPLLRCGLALTGANRVVAGESIEGSEDGILTAFEVSGLNLVGTELAVLSACETGVGEVRNGEGVYGLRRVFQYAGAETIVMSLWKVPDEETVELMRGFYERWLSGMRKKDALRESILSRIAEERERYGTAHPLLWGGFILTGNPE